MNKATILIVEDSPDISQSLADAFRFSDFAVLQADDASQALQFAREKRPNLILMDIQLPDQDGLSVARTLKAEPATKHIPIIAMTAYDVEAHHAKAMTQTCAAYVQKPVRPRELVNLATAIIKLPTPPEPPTGRSRPPKPPGR
jgi:two-component system cell cycle response regulator DivK